VHATIEEEVFYPAAREALGEDADLVDEADIEHASAKELIAQIEGSSPEDDHFDARVKVLGEYIDHHVKEEEGEMFPKVKKAKLDTAALGTALVARKEELIAALSEEAAH
jgi:hemerythrin superfamily protein